MMATLIVPMTLSAVLAARNPAAASSTHSARVGGALMTTLTGGAVFGPVRWGGPGSASFSLTLGAYSERGAVSFSTIGGTRPGVGTYSVSLLEPGAAAGDQFHALVSLGAPESPLGVFRAVSGSLTITVSDDEQVVGRYEIRAIGFMAADPDREDREITVRGGFTAEPAAFASSFEATIGGELSAIARGAAEFGEVEGNGVRSFTLSLGAHSEKGAVIFARQGAGNPPVGSYEVRQADPASPGFHALVITGAPSQPTGVFRVQRGTLTITESTASRLSGHFQLWAEGFLAREMDRDDRVITASGSFIATAGDGVTSLTLH